MTIKINQSSPFHCSVLHWYLYDDYVEPVPALFENTGATPQGFWLCSLFESGARGQLPDNVPRVLPYLKAVDFEFEQIYTVAIMGTT